MHLVEHGNSVEGQAVEPPTDTVDLLLDDLCQVGDLQEPQEPRLKEV